MITVRAAETAVLDKFFIRCAAGRGIPHPLSVPGWQTHPSVPKGSKAVFQAEILPSISAEYGPRSISFAHWAQRDYALS